MSDCISNQDITGEGIPRYEYVPEEETVVITAAEYDQLKKDQLRYEVLIQAGVESWEGYDRFLSMLGE